MVAGPGRDDEGVMTTAHEKYRWALIAALLLLTAPAFAQHIEIEGVNTDGAYCNPIRSIWDYRICAEMDFDAANAELNTIYAELATRFDSPPDLSQVEHDWIRFRDSWCTYALSREHDEGGNPIADSGEDGRLDMEKLLQSNITSGVYHRCLTRLTREHIERLHKTLE